MSISHKEKTALILLSLIVILGIFFYLEYKNLSKNNPVSVTPNTATDHQSTPITEVTPKDSQTPQNNPASFEYPTESTKIDATKKALTTNELLSGMELTFEDNFNELSRYVDQNGNITCEAGGKGIWQSVYHFCSRTIPSNYEAEIYIDQNFIDYLNSKGNGTTSARNSTWVDNGILTIEAKPTDSIIQNAAGSWAKYTSGLLTTQFSFSQQYGYFEMRAKMPAGKGLWPAFWLLPIDKSWPPEIDVMEFFGGLNAKGEGGLTTIHYASHTVKKSGLCGTWHDVGVDLTKDFHTYGVYWQPDKITYFFDGVAYASCPGNPDANQPFYLLVNLAVGSTAAWPSSPNSTNSWPAYMYVDYVRAYQDKTRLN